MNQKALFAEFVGTFTLIFAGVASICANAMSNGALGVTGIALAHGLAIACMASATAAVSGGHLNPAVTIGAFLGKKIDAVGAVGYIIAQCLGGIVAAYLITHIFPSEVLSQVHMGTPAPGAGVTTTQLILMEAILTFFLVFVVFGTAIDARAPKVGALFIGLTVTLDILAGGGITGAAMNPARHLGPALLGGGMEHVVWYWVGPLLGAALAALSYQNLMAK